MIAALILIMLWLITCAASAAAGFWIAGRIHKPAARAQPVPPTPEQQLAAQKMKLEYKNFLDYDGTIQEPVDAALR